ncbi:MAG: hypothetical protein IKP65_06225 [Alphaproteobacteria bacterium]|nr:hypothetical protein [Alphaproteobacteria bacterium]
MIYKDFLNICNDCGLTFDKSTAKFNGTAVAAFWFYELMDSKEDKKNYEKTGTVLVIDDNCRIMSSSESIEVAKKQIQERMKSIKKQAVDERIDDLNKDFE